VNIIQVTIPDWCYERAAREIAHERPGLSNAEHFVAVEERAIHLDAVERIVAHDERMGRHTP
jgi:hypothetical protein